MPILALGLAAGLSSALSAAASPLALIPRPSKLTTQTGYFTLTARTRIAAQPQAQRAGTLLAEWLAADTGVHLPIGTAATNVIALRIRPGAAAYSLRVMHDRAEIESSTSEGLIQGCQTLRQLLVQSGGAWMLPRVEIEDSPRLGWRGLMLDCSRTFLSLSYLKKNIDLMSYYKLNVLQLHLTDDQGWRIEIKKHPKLTDIGSRFAARYKDERGGYYSQDEIRELVRYAAERGVTIVPEIEMPGHALAALTAYPELSCTGGPFEIYPFFSGPNISEDVFCLGNEGTFRLLEDVLDEVASLFPGQFIHLGGDECPKTRWRSCPKCQARIRAEGLRDESALQGYLIGRMARFLEARHKRVIGWDEIAEGGAAPGAAVMVWRGIDALTVLAKAGHDAVLSPASHCYLDYKQSDLPQELGEGSKPVPLDKVYSFDPLPAALDRDISRHVLGAQGAMWTHYARTEGAIDRQLFPRLAALAEAFWTPQELRQWPDFKERLQAHCRRLAAMGVELGLNLRPDPGAWAEPAMAKP
jgi:hexosaminidase